MQTQLLTQEQLWQQQVAERERALVPELLEAKSREEHASLEVQEKYAQGVADRMENLLHLLLINLRPMVANGKTHLLPSRRFHSKNNMLHLSLSENLIALSTRLTIICVSQSGSLRHYPIITIKGYVSSISQPFHVP